MLLFPAFIVNSSISYSIFESGVRSSPFTLNVREASLYQEFRFWRDRVRFSGEIDTSMGDILRDLDFVSRICGNYGDGGYRMGTFLYIWGLDTLATFLYTFILSNTPALDHRTFLYA